MKKYILLLVLLFGMLTTNVFADSFVVKKIELQGLQRVSADTVYNYLSIKPGQTLSSDKTAGIIRSLYKTGFN